jgi:hypothetical protein
VSLLTYTQRKITFPFSSIAFISYQSII